MLTFDGNRQYFLSKKTKKNILFKHYNVIMFNGGMKMFSVFEEKGLNFKDEVAKEVFENHINELKVRIANDEYLDTPLDDSMLDQVAQNIKEISDDILIELGASKNINSKLESFLLATHIMMMKEKDE
ncbi:MAG: hypothetical protein ACK5HS_04175 [Mycoplasmatales bacterium]